jgi:hypothetical protein
VNSSNALSEDAPPSAEVLLRASDMSIESILKGPIFSDSTPQMATALEIPLIRVVGQPDQSRNSQTTMVRFQISTPTPSIDWCRTF